MGNQRSMRGWPASLVEIAEITSVVAALKLVHAFGGTSVYVSKDVAEDDRLTPIIGAEAAAAIANAFGGDRLHIPLLAAKRHLKPLILEAEGSAREVALRLGTTERYVRMVRNAGRERPNTATEPDASANTRKDTA